MATTYQTTVGTNRLLGVLIGGVPTSLDSADTLNLSLANTTFSHSGGAFTISGGDFDFTGTNVDLDPTGTFALDMDASQTATITVADNLADAFLVQQGSDAYIDVTTTDASEAINLGNVTTNPTLSQLGTGQVAFAGNVNANNGLDVTTAALTSSAGITNTAGEVLVSGGNVQFNDSITVSFGTGDDATMSFDGSDFTLDQASAFSTIIKLGADDNTADFQVQTNTGNPIWKIEPASASTAAATLTGDMTISNNLTVNGTMTIAHEEEVNVGDTHFYMHSGYTTVAASSFGLVGNYLPTATNDTVAATGFVASAGAANAYVNTTGAATFSAGDLVQISGANNNTNNGLFEVHTHAANVLTIRGLGSTGTTFNFIQNDFVTDTTVAGTITKINCSIIRAGSDGLWEYAIGSTTSGMTFTDFGTATGNSLQQAYVQGNTISMTDAEGDFDVSVTSGTPAISLDAADASNFTVASTQAAHDLTLSVTGATDSSVLIASSGTSATDAISITTSAGGMLVDSNGAMTLDAGGVLELNSDGGAISIGNDANAQAVNIATGAAARVITIGNAASASMSLDAGVGAFTAQADTTMDLDSGGALSVNSSGGAISIGNDAVAQPVNIATGAAARVITIGNAASASMDLDAGAGAFTAQADTTMDLDSGGALSINSSGGAINVGNDAIAQNINVGTGAAVRTITIGNATGATALDLNAGTGGVTVDTTDGGAVSIDAIGAPSNFSLASTAGGDDLTIAVTGATDSSLVLSSSGTNAADALQITTSAGGMAIDSNGAMTLDAGGVLELNSDGGAISIGNDADAQPVNIATGAAARVITIGNAASASMDLDAGVGAFTAQADTTMDLDSGGALSINSSGGAINVGDDAVAQNINVGTGAAARTVTIGNATGATALDLNAGTGGVTVDTTDGGAISLDAIGAPSNFSLASTAGGDDLTVAVTGATDSSLVLSSSGTGADALQITATAGGINVNMVDNNATAYVIQEGANAYMTFITTDASELIQISENTRFDDDITCYFGTGNDWGMTYDEAVDDALELVGATSAVDVAGTAYTITGSTGGASSGGAAGTGGEFNWTAGTGGAASAAGAAGVGGAVNLAAGVGGIASEGNFDGAVGGALNFDGGVGGAGTASQVGGAGGAVSIDAGAGGATGGAGAGAAGAITIGTTTASAVTIANSGADTTIQGGAHITAPLTGTVGLRIDNGAGTGYDIGTAANPIGNIFQASYLEQAEQADPSVPSSNRGQLYMKDDGSGNTELYFQNSGGVPEQITGGGATTIDLQEAYDNGNQIIEDATGTTQITQGVAAAAIPNLTIDYDGATDYTGALSGIEVDFSSGQSFNTASSIYGINLKGKTNAEGSNVSVGINLDTGWDQAMTVADDTPIQLGDSGGYITWNTAGAEALFLATGASAGNEQIIIHAGYGVGVDLAFNALPVSNAGNTDGFNYNVEAGANESGTTRLSAIMGEWSNSGTAQTDAGNPVVYLNALRGDVNTNASDTNTGVLYNGLYLQGNDNGGTGTLNAIYVDSTWDYSLFVSTSGGPVHLDDGVNIAFGSGDDVTLGWTGSLLKMLPAVDDTGAFEIGDGTTDFDVKWFAGAAADFVLFDMGAKYVEFDGVDLHLKNDDILAFGDTQDAQIRFDGTDIDVLATNDDTPWKWGNGTNSWDMWWYGDTAANTMIFDASASTLTLDDVDLYLGDSDLLVFGDGSDVTMRWDGTDMDVLALADDQVWIWGTSSENWDMKWWGQASSSLVFDASANTWTYDNQDIYLGDNDSINFGDGVPDFSIVHDATNTLLTNVSGDLVLNNTGADILFETDNDAEIGVKQGLLADGVGVAAGDAAAVNSSGNVVKADATTSTGLQTVVGIAVSAAVSVEAELALPGTVVTVSTDLGAGGDNAPNGTVMYLSETAGAITKTAPTASGSTVYRVGVVVDQTGDRILYMPQFITNNP